MKQYFVLEASSPQELEKMVNDAIKKENKQPYAGPWTVSGAGGAKYCQVMAYYVEKEN